MTYLLDSNGVNGLLRGRPRNLVDRVLRDPADQVGFSSPVAHELYYGAPRSESQGPGLEGIDVLPFKAIPFDHSDARESGRVRAELARTGKLIGRLDVLIAGQALAGGWCR